MEKMGKKMEETDQTEWFRGRSGKKGNIAEHLHTLGQTRSRFFLF